MDWLHSDKRGGSMNPWYAKDCVFNNDVYIESTNIVLGIEGFTERSILSLSRKWYGALAMANSISNAINELYVSLGGFDGLTSTTTVRGIVRIVTQSSDLPTCY